MMDKLSQYGIRVHDILPGSVDTPLKNSQIETTRDITGNQDEYKNVKKILEDRGFELESKKQSKIIASSKMNFDVYNQIWHKKNRGVL